MMANIPRKVSSKLDFESLAAAVRLRGCDDPGQRFAKLGILGSPEKREARLRARAFMLDESFRSFLTMPGIFFVFEALLLAKRERNRVFRDKRRRPEKTYITCLEREEEIYRAGFRYMPGLSHGYVKHVDTVPGAKHSYQTPFIFRYHQTTFEDYATLGVKYDAAFLDFNGPITWKRCAAIRAFCRLSKPRILVVNSMNGRYKRGSDGESAKADLIEACEGMKPVEEFKYGQFRQLTFSRRAG